MKKKSYKRKKVKWNIIDELKRCLNICSIFGYILQNQECVANELIQATQICKPTLYKYLNKGNELELIGKKTNGDSNKHRAHYIWVPTPKLSEFLEEIRGIIIEFLRNHPEFREFFDNSEQPFLIKLRKKKKC